MNVRITLGANETWSALIQSQERIYLKKNVEI